MIPFLQSIAEGYANKISAEAKAVRPGERPIPRPDEYCFVFPNKRAGTFFLKYFRSAMARLHPTSLSPKITTITDLTGRLSGRIVESRIELIFLLYKCYLEFLSPEMDSKEREQMQTFDSFRRWGETVLSDFNEVDMHLTDPEAIFKNISDFRKINTTFLTDEQREVIEEYFGYSAAKHDNSKFWVDFSDDFDDPDSPTRKKFVHLWKIMYPLYLAFNREMEQRGIATTGATYRLAVENLSRADEEGTVEELLPYQKMVMVGFNALSGAERRLFSLLKSLPSPGIEGESLADFVWDATGPVILHSRNSAGHFVSRNISLFPAPQWIFPFLAKSDAGNRMPEITAIASPSKVSQVKIASECLTELREEIGELPFRRAKVAMVLPDEGLLLPLLYSLPRNIEDANLTMGYPLKLTGVTSFLSLLRRMQMMRRDSSQYSGYAYQEVSDILSHPYSHAIIGTPRIRAFNHHFETHHISVVRESDILKYLGEEAAAILRPLPADAKPRMVTDYLDSVLAMIERTLLPANNSMLKGEIETANIHAWREALRTFTDAIEEYDIPMSARSVMAEAYRLLQGEIVPFEGEPLKGLQIMGLLETRALDFDHIVVVSVNDKVIPMRSRKRSFLPNVIRRGYGMPPVNYQENIFSYYFYRLISRARRVTLIYDNRASGLSGGVSRYLMQLKYLHARGELKEMEYKFNPTIVSPVRISVDKTDPATTEALSLLLNPEVNEKGRRRNLSASTLKKFIDCPLQFYYYSICNLPDDPEPSEGIDNVTYGTLIHSVMEHLLLPENEIGKGRWLDPPRLITKEMLDGILADKERIAALITRFINKLHYKERDNLARPLQPDTQLVAESAMMQIIGLLEHDRSLAPFNLYGCEVKGSLEHLLPVEDSGAAGQGGKGDGRGKRINVTFSIDRVDDAECDGDPLTVRIIDYKTGNPHVSALSFDALFTSDYTCSQLRQLLFYAQMLNEWREAQGEKPLSVKPLIYPVAKMRIKAERDKGIPKLKSYVNFMPRSQFEKIERHDREVVLPPADIAEERLSYEAAAALGLTADSPELRHTTLDAEFLPRLDATINRILDPSVPFEAIYPQNKCLSCTYAKLCAEKGRVMKE